MATSDAITRETAWLSTAGDGLPALLESAGGPFDDVHAYFARVPASEARTLYVLRNTLVQKRFAAVRMMSTYAFRLIAWWPILDVTGDAEAEQQALDNAVDLAVTRVTDLLGDKTHGGRFLSVAEPQGVTVQWHDPTVTMQTGYLRADLTYDADDPEFPG